MHTTELLSILYELSLTNLKYLEPRDTAESFVKKFISRKSLNAGGVWTYGQGPQNKLQLNPIYTTPQSPETVYLDQGVLEQAFGSELLIVRNSSLLPNRKMKGRYAYFKLNDFGLLEFFAIDRAGSFTKESLSPFVDVMVQFAISLESGFYKEQLQAEIDNRKKAEERLKKSEEKYRRIIDNVRLGLLNVDQNDRIQHANQAFLNLTGYKLKEVVGKEMPELFLDADSKKLMQENNTSRQQGRSSSYQLKIRDKEGRSKWCVISGAPNYDNGGTLIGSIGIFLDITEQKALRQENEFKTNQLNKLFEMSLDALISIDSKGAIFEWSPRAETIFGYRKEEVLGKGISETIIPQIHREAHKEGMQTYMATDHGPILNNRIEIIGLHKKGHIIPIELTVFPMEYNQERYFTSFVRDISDIKASEEAMERALARQKELNALKSQFISTTSHELRTPLTTIRSNTELLSYKLEHPEHLKVDKMQKNVSRIAQNVERLNQLISNILMIGKLDSEKIPFHPKPFDIQDYLKSQILPDFESRKQPIEYQIEGTERLVEIDPNLFQHILTNLLENALKYSEGKPPPSLSLLFKEEQWRIQIKDYGIGIPPEDQERLFESFYRASNVDNIQGTGLGLAIVKQYIEIHSGTIQVDSEVGKGSTFTLGFPYKLARPQSGNA